MITINLRGPSPLLYQWDTDRQVEFRSFNDYIVDEVHFARIGDSETINVIPYRDGNRLVADIPNSLLTSTDGFTAYAVLNTENGKRTCSRQFFAIMPRPKPSSYIYTEEDQEDQDEQPSVISYNDLTDKPCYTEYVVEDFSSCLFEIVETDQEIDFEILNEYCDKVTLRVYSYGDTTSRAGLSEPVDEFTLLRASEQTEGFWIWTSDDVEVILGYDGQKVRFLSPNELIGAEVDLVVEVKSPVVHQLDSKYVPGPTVYTFGIGSLTAVSDWDKLNQHLSNIMSEKSGTITEEDLAEIVHNWQQGKAIVRFIRTNTLSQGGVCIYTDAVGMRFCAADSDASTIRVKFTVLSDEGSVSITVGPEISTSLIYN